MFISVIETKLLFLICTNFIFNSERRPMIPSCESCLVRNMQRFTLSQTLNTLGIFFPKSHVATRHRSFHGLSLVARAALVRRLRTNSGDGKTFVHQQRNPRLQKLVIKVKLGDGDSTATTTTTTSNVELGDGDSKVATTEESVEAEKRGGLSEGLKARIYLFLVPFMWGTYGPALRFIYSQPVAPSASFITLSRKVASIAFFLLLQPLEEAMKGTRSTEEQNMAVASKDESRAARISLRSSWGPAVELGFWTFLGTALQTNALGSTTAIRAGFILSTITVLVPLISAASGGHVSTVTWGAAVIAFFGVFLMSIFGNETGGLSTILCNEGSPGCQTATLGDLEVLAAAGFYAIHTIRLGDHAKTMSALELSTRVMIVSTVFTFGWAGYDYATAALEGRDGGLAWQGLTSPEVAGATIFAAFAPGTLAHLAQAVGQKTIPPSEAQVYYSLAPVCSALFAAFFLHESLTPLGWGAGGLVVLATLLASTQNSSPQKK